MTNGARETSRVVNCSALLFRKRGLPCVARASWGVTDPGYVQAPRVPAITGLGSAGLQRLRAVPCGGTLWVQRPTGRREAQAQRQAAVPRLGQGCGRYGCCHGARAAIDCDGSAPRTAVLLLPSHRSRWSGFWRVGPRKASAHALCCAEGRAGLGPEPLNCAGLCQWKNSRLEPGSGVKCSETFLMSATVNTDILSGLLFSVLPACF